MKYGGVWAGGLMWFVSLGHGAVAQQPAVHDGTPEVPPFRRFETTPVLAMYLPVGVLMDGIDRMDRTPMRRRQIGAASVGARLAWRTNRTFGLEGSLIYAPSLVAVTDESTTRDLGGRVLLMSARAVVRTRESSGGWAFHAAPGLGLVNRHGPAWSRTSGTTDVAAVLAAGLRLRVPELRGSFRFELEDYVTRTGFDHPRESSRSSVHHDMLWSFGYVIPL